MLSGHVGAIDSEATTTFPPKQTYNAQVTGYRHRRQEVSTCAGLASYFACPQDVGGGCCPQGLICATDGACSPSPVTSTATTVFCDQNWFACPSSFGGKSPACSKMILARQLIVGLSGGCCSGGATCGPGDCTWFSPLTTTTLSPSSGGQIGTAVSTITSAHVSSQISPSRTSVLSVVVSGTETAARVTETVFATGGLTPGQIGGISAGAVVGFLLLVAVGWLIVRHLVRISRFMDKFDISRQETVKERDGSGDTRGAEVTVLDSGNVVARQDVTELSPQQRPQMLEEWGRHGSRGPELAGSYGAHGISELDSAPRESPKYRMVKHQDVSTGN